MADVSTHDQRAVPPRGTESERRRGRRADEETRSARVLTGASASEAVIGAAAVVVAVLGLIGTLPFYMAAIATIAVGAALLIEGLGIAAQVRALEHELVGNRQTGALIGGTSVEVVGGVAGIVLGVLALFGVEPFVMLAIAAIVYGGTLIFGTGASRQVDAAASMRGGYGGVSHQALVSSDGAKILGGIAAATLGILYFADVGVGLTLILSAMLVAGLVNLLSGTALAARTGATLH